MNESIKTWVRHEQSRRLLNRFYALLASLCIVFAVTVSPGSLLLLPIIVIFAGLSNVCMLLGRPRIEATDEEIRASSEAAPGWFLKLINKLDTQT